MKGRLEGNRIDIDTRNGALVIRLVFHSNYFWIHVSQVMDAFPKGKSNIMCSALTILQFMTIFVSKVA